MHSGNFYEIFRRFLTKFELNIMGMSTFHICHVFEELFLKFEILNHKFWEILKLTKADSASHMQLYKSC